MKKKTKKPVSMKPLELDPCATCLYGKARNQHNVPKAVEKFNKVKPSEAFGKVAKPKKAKKKVTKKKKRVAGVIITPTLY
tara:strand:- start:370 stop:609 length:240 start_codon:yes stop_codon:yes gene_type:complete